MKDAQTQCWKCAHALPEGARFCLECGVAQSDEARQAAAGPLGHQATELDVKRDAGIPIRLIPPGTRLSNVYIVEEVIGEGGMGVVYRAWDEVRKREVAIKALHVNLVGEPGIRRRFVREAQLMTGRGHPNVVRIYDTIVHDELLALVMECIKGPSLSAYLERWGGQLPFEEIKLVFDGVLSAMAMAHEAGVIHRDLKPDNILLQEDGGAMIPKVVDFGIAKVIEGTQFTLTGAVLGTCRYMSPEQVESPDSLDHRSDIYSLGVTLYQLVTGRCPFETDNNFALMMAHVRQEPPRPSLYRPGMPSALEKLILDALSKSPRDRPVSCEAFRKRLGAALAGVTPSRPSARGAELEDVIEDADGNHFQLVPGGTFVMGPRRREVYLDAYYIARHPVTNRQFARFLEVTGYRPEDSEVHRFLSHWRSDRPPRRLLDHPVVFVSWLDARAYCAWAGCRLPTEAEWEKAARGDDGRKYPWGRGEPSEDRANFGRKKGGTTKVGAFPEGSSPCGAEDMAGNVWEWCEDVDDPKFYLTGPTRNPHNTVQPGDAPHVIRGGSWLYDASSLRTFTRSSFRSHFRLDGVGFRCVLA